MLGALLKFFGSIFDAPGATMLEARRHLAESKVSYAELAGHVARLNHVRLDQEKGMYFFQGQAEKLLNQGKKEEAREAARKYLEYVENHKKTTEGISRLKGEMQMMSAEMQTLESKICAMVAQNELHHAKMGIIRTKTTLKDNEVEWEAQAAKADALEQMAGLSIKDELFVDKELEEEFRNDAVDQFLLTLKAKKK